MGKNWENKLVKTQRLNSPLVEVTPFVFKNRLYRLENWQKLWDLPLEKRSTRHYQADEVRIRDIEEDKIISIPLIGYTFATAFVWNEKVYIFAGDHHSATAHRFVKQIVMTCSEDLTNWSEPRTVWNAVGDENLFNFAVCHNGNNFVMLYETDDCKWLPKFTFKFCESADLINWQLIDNALYGKNKYVGGPALYYENNFYYLLYLEELAHGWETRIARSQDLLNWEDAPPGRAFLAYDSSIKHLPCHTPEVCECNASDAELCYWQGKTLVYFTGGIQKIAGDLQLAEFAGTPQELLEYFFI